jgi:hypothetical protein
MNMTKWIRIGEPFSLLAHFTITAILAFLPAMVYTICSMP